MVGVGITNKHPCVNEVRMLRSQVIEQRVNVLRRMFPECHKEASSSCERGVGTWGVCHV